VPYTYNASNEMLTREGVPYTYDADGNTLGKKNGSGTTSYSWDFENRLTSVTFPTGGVVSFKYDPFGRRIQKTSPAGTTAYVYDGDNILEELTGSTGTLSERYTYGPGIDEPLVGQRQPKIFYYEADGLGSVTSLTDPTGAVAATYTYDSFGFMTASTGSATNWYRYTARQFDSDTGLYYYRARYYDPITGRFVNEDPIGSRGGINFYAYAGNSPTQLGDPYGLSPTCRRLDPNSRCADLFKQVFHLSPEQFNEDINKIPWFYFPNISGMNNLSWDFISGNGDPALIRTRFAGQSVAAATAVGGSPANPSPVVLGPDWFAQSTTHQSETMLHEAVHSITGWGDDRIFNTFSKYGLPSNDYRKWGNTDEFTKWLMDGCPQ
jgi:RHS repeat-associated protein